MWHIVAIVNHDSSHLILLSDETAVFPTVLAVDWVWLSTISSIWGAIRKRKACRRWRNGWVIAYGAITIGDEVCSVAATAACHVCVRWWGHLSHSLTAVAATTSCVYSVLIQSFIHVDDCDLLSCRITDPLSVYPLSLVTITANVAKCYSIQEAWK